MRTNARTALQTLHHFHIIAYKDHEAHPSFAQSVPYILFPYYLLKFEHLRSHLSPFLIVKKKWGPKQTVFWTPYK